jgi:HEXXH motif-containing protein
VPFSVTLVARDGLLVLPSIGALRTSADDISVKVLHRRRRLTFRQTGAVDVVVHLGDAGVTRSDAAAWTSVRSLPGLLPGSAPVWVDDLDPYRISTGGPGRFALVAPAAVPVREYVQWSRSWSETTAMLRLGGDDRLMEAAALLRCLVPLAVPAGTTARSESTGSCSGTWREAFGAVLSSAPATPAAFAAMLVHEIQHAKLAALSDTATLHHAGPSASYFAPWRPDPRPFDALLHGVYSHVALAHFFQRCAISDEISAVQRGAAWKQYARCRLQVDIALRQIERSNDLTDSGRIVLIEMIDACTNMDGIPPPRDAKEAARTYVRGLHDQWMQRREPYGGGSVR